MALLSNTQRPELPSLLSWLPLIGVNPVACFLLVALPICQVTYNISLHPLRKYPGPKLASVSSLYNTYWDCTGRHHVQIKNLHDQYGDVIRWAPNTLVYRNSGAWKDIYSHRRHGMEAFQKDPKLYRSGPSGVSLIGANDADHARQRRLLSHAFSERALSEQGPLIQRYVDLLLTRQRTLATASKLVDVAEWYDYATFDIIGDLTFGESLSCLADSKYHAWVPVIFQTLKASVFVRAMLYYVPQWLFTAFVPARLKEMRNNHYRLTGERLYRRLSMQTDRPDFMSYILRHNDERDMTATEIQGISAIMMVAGTETAATLYLEDITFLSVAQLPYLQCVLEESLRIYPPGSGLLPRQVPAGGANINGRYVPGGTTVGVCIFSALRSRDNFVDADSFIPERWMLSSRDPRFDADKREAMQFLLYGSRNCIGRNLAYTEMRVILAKLLWEFDLTLGDGCSNWDKQCAYVAWQKKALNGSWLGIRPKGP
ncbi:benzoate 4-monooxygenase cytochrome P450 [Aspergillus heteromorphus CBS 117.55]|uniref:Benzoate 4-monooxygenase cytochrome P450 n=1 Tax=Aspergillus heteromorphus CBS 117.55 TaxID=1448321 RepID=A0A317VBW0_9EURO|nr:benzoate 4-monooxygenase cytochrome P450 [Aspergillus heteromorphus CBS 117.55]PWY71706.1 benzoate 4-monooxygenase cytochrome P450 [Aspergillus heteromorphus CBS 117.55]